MATRAQAIVHYHEAPRWLAGAIVGVVAGLVMAMVGMIYTAIIGTGFWAIPAGIAEVLVPAASTQTVGGVVLGLGIHMMLSAALGLVWVFGVHTFLKSSAERGSLLVLPALIYLLAVWAFNWYVLLPALFPSFIEVMSFGPALIFHLLFGILLVAYVRLAVHED